MGRALQTYVGSAERAFPLRLSPTSVPPSPSAGLNAVLGMPGSPSFNREKSKRIPPAFWQAAKRSREIDSAQVHQSTRPEN
eukprot:CAMPEP_0171663992 /NCGR_PEP_ID=MMETSP0990-20121206/46510_1 /TAXON_ID=483369 /ORGANISM="non described non described, Strain CCMP2098" /LENGTH=80 /DNA_ID=CAMNT_0012246769 /DNA_START=721 /DNA_END=963 /DNA_ORIENTATION=+